MGASSEPIGEGGVADQLEPIAITTLKFTDNSPRFQILRGSYPWGVPVAVLCSLQGGLSVHFRRTLVGCPACPSDDSARSAGKRPHPAPPGGRNLTQTGGEPSRLPHPRSKGTAIARRSLFDQRHLPYLREGF